MPTKIPSPQKKRGVSSRQKKTDAAVSLFRKEVEEQERLVEALRTHQLDRNARVDRIKALLASGSELASAVGAWEGSGKQEDNKASSSSRPLPPSLPIHHHVDPSLLDSDQAKNAANGDHAAPAVSGGGDGNGEGPTDTTVVLAPPQTDSSRAAVTDGDNDNDDGGEEEDGMPLSVDARVSEIKGLAANMMQAVLEEFGGYMAGMEQHRAMLEEIRQSSPSAKQPIVASAETAEKRDYNGDADPDVEAEEEAALNELVAFRQSIKDKRKKKKAKQAAQRAATRTKNPSAVATSPLDPSATPAPSHQPLSPDADLYVNLLDKLLADGRNMGVEGGGVATAPPVDITGTGDGDAPSWLSEFEPPSTVGVTAGISPAEDIVPSSPQAGGGATVVAVAANGRRPRRPIVEEEVEECYSDDFEA